MPDEVHAADEGLRFLRPSHLFLQAGVTADDTRSYVGGAIWDWAWHRQVGLAGLTGYSEIAFGRWTGKGATGRSSAWETQVGLTPVIRIHPRDLSSHWFAELGIGANLILPVYRSGSKRFSTTFNFGDHIGIGHTFGAAGQHTLQARLEHFSNGGAKHPNPGENFYQLRYSRAMTRE